MARRRNSRSPKYLPYPALHCTAFNPRFATVQCIALSRIETHVCVCVRGCETNPPARYLPSFLTLGHLPASKHASVHTWARHRTYYPVPLYPLPNHTHPQTNPRSTISRAASLSRLRVSYLYYTRSIPHMTYIPCCTPRLPLLVHPLNTPALWHGLAGLRCWATHPASILPVHSDRLRCHPSHALGKYQAVSEAFTTL